jgi:lysophospholipase L1-like esterase
MIRSLPLLISALALLCSSTSALACPKVGGLPDLNCDREAKVLVLGDSLVFGIGDTDNDNKGGYLLRTSLQFPNASFLNYGVGGRRVSRTIGDLEAAFLGTGDTQLANDLADADVVFFDFGRNDWWERKPPLATWRNLKRCRDIIQTNVQRITGHKPLVITAQMSLANRTGQGTWVVELNALLAQKSTSSTPADLRFNALSKKLLGDQVHPTPKGYQILAKIFTSYLTKVLPKHAAKFRKDEDADGLYDEYERERFGMDPTLQDTDGDGIKDGDEV